MDDIMKRLLALGKVAADDINAAIDIADCAADEIETLRARVAELEKERDEARVRADDIEQKWWNNASELQAQFQAERDALAAENAELIKDTELLQRQITSLIVERDEANASAGTLATEKAKLRIAAEALVKDIDELMAGSIGVAGLHRNGDLAPWDEITAGGRFEEWLLSHETARAALASASDKGGDDVYSMRS